MRDRIHAALLAVSATDRLETWIFRIGGGALAVIAGLLVAAGVLWDFVWV